MVDREIDAVDRRILYQLQRDARNRTAVAIGDEVGVSDTTVRTRIARLEEAGVIRGYRPIVDYERAGFQRPFLFTCTVPIVDREEHARQALEVPGVVGVTEIMTGRENLHVEVVTETADDVADAVRALTRLGGEIVDEHAIRDAHYTPLAHLLRP